MFFLTTGVLLVHIHNPYKQGNYAGNFIKEQKQIFKAYVCEQPKSGKKNTRYTLQLQQINETFLKEISGRAYLYVKSTNGKIFPYGTTILFSAILSPVKGPANPADFDFKKYSFYKGITLQGYANATEIINLDSENGNLFRRKALQLQQILQHSLALHLKGESLNIANALVLGYDDEIGNDLLQAYSVTGVLHVLSVSGMHVALVYAVLNYLLGLLFRNNKGKYFKLFISIGFIWFYAFVTGLSPSVQRAALMISFIITSQAINRSYNIYNTLLASALLLLLSDPFLIYDIGFQFSFLSVFGIVFIHSWLYQQYTPKWKYADKLWEMISVCLSAQLITFPLSIYYFHQFPVYFLPANLIIVPLTTIIMYGCILLLIVSPVKVLAYYMAKACSCIIDFLNDAVLFINHLPFASWSNIYWSSYITLVLYLFIICLALFFIYNQKRWLYYSFHLILLLTIIGISEDYFISRQKKLLVYAIKNNTCIDFVSGTKCYTYSDSLLSGRDYKSLCDNRGSLGIKEIQTLEEDLVTSDLCSRGDYMKFNNKSIFLMREEKPVISVDFILLRNTVHYPKLKNLNSIFITSAGIRKKYLEKLKTNYTRRVHSLWEDGAMVVEL